MKKVLIIAISIMFSSSILIGQEPDFDTRLLEGYSKKELKKISRDNPSEIEFLTFCIENACYISSFPAGKKSAEELKFIEIKDLKKINFHELNVELIQDNYQYFKVKDGDKLLLLVVKSKDHILTAMK